MVPKDCICVVHLISQYILDQPRSQIGTESRLKYGIVPSDSIMRGVVASPEDCLRLYVVPYVLQSLVHCDYRDITGALWSTKLARFDPALVCIVTAAIGLPTVCDGVLLVPEVSMEVRNMNYPNGLSLI
jgi:hypothetical protein